MPMRRFAKTERERVEMQPEKIVTASDILERAAEAGVFLSYSQERLHFKLAVDVFPEELKREILANKIALIEFLSQRESERSVPRILPRVRETNELPASFAQQRLWFVDQMGGSPQYNMPGGLHVRGKFSEDVAEHALRRIVERHEPLRTVFRDGDGALVQHIRDSFDFTLQRIDLRGVEPEQQEQL